MPDSSHTSKYEESGVSQSGAETALGQLLKHILPTRGFNPDYPLKADIGYFANVIDLGNGEGVALCTDGVGTKLRVAEMMQKYDTIGIDCVAMNVNDLICIGARPVSLVDYIACGHIDPDVFDQLGKGLAEGARQAGISICGGEISQIGEIIQGIDLIGAALGHIKLDRINTGRHVERGNLVLGLASSGVHSNGLTLARRVLLGETDDAQTNAVHTHDDALGRTLGAELLEPTRIYVQPVLEILKAGIDVKAMVHLTGGGFLNLLRVQKKPIRFVIDPLPDIPPVFSLIRERGGIPDAEMYEVFNMGIGFCIVVEHANDAEAVQKICKRHGVSCHGIGYVETADGPESEVIIPSLNLKGTGTRFGVV